jgi:hypothetical protein
VWFWDKTKADKAKLGPGDKKVPGDCGLTKAEQRREEEVQASSGLLRITFTAQSIWNRIPFTTLFGLTVLLPVAYNVTDKYVVSRVQFAKYLRNDIRLEYENFYYTIAADPHLKPQRIYELAEKLLKTINGQSSIVPYLKLRDYGEDNRMNIIYFIFSLKTIALFCMTHKKLPPYLPTSQQIEKNSIYIEDFMEKYAWRSFLWPSSMNRRKLVMDKSYTKMLEVIRNNPELWGIFSQDCDAKCFEEVKTLSVQ